MIGQGPQLDSNRIGSERNEHARRVRPPHARRCHPVVETFMLSLKTPVVAALSLAAAIGASASFAADGDLDPSFGTGGIAYITPDLVDAQELQPYKAIVLPDG